MEESADSPKSALLLESGRKLFWKYGFRRVTVDEICKEAGVSKMTFYRCFENKTELAKTIFRNIVNEGIDKFNEIINSDIPSPEKLHKILLMKLDGTNEISRDFMMDFYNSPDTELQKFVEETTSKAWKGIVDGFRHAQDKGWLRQDFKPEFLLFITQYMAPMLTDEKLLKFYDNQQDLIMEFAKFFTYGISPHE